MAYLVLVRHGETDWNILGLFSGQTDVPLNEKGRQQAKNAAKLLNDIKLDKGYTSNLSRAKDTLNHILQSLKTDGVQIIETDVLAERSYGVFEGQSKKEAAEKYGKDNVEKIRRAWEYPVSEGETLKAVHDRVTSYYEEHILKDLKDHKNVIVASHNNTIRALIKYLENLSVAEVEKLELGNAEVYVYEIDNDGKMIRKEIRA